MSTTRAALTQGDIQSLVRGATIDERAAAAHKLCRRIDEIDLTDEDRVVAHEILRVMAGDAAELVRRALAVTLKASTAVPRDVALKLARDVESVAAPMLSFSPVFTDEDLIEIIRYAGPVRQVAIATRVSLPESVTNALVEHGAESAVRAACANDNATFTEGSLQKAISRFANSQQLLAAVAYRQALPPSVAERLVNMVSDQVRDHLINNHALPPETALQIAVGARERATIDLVDQAGRAVDMERFVEHLVAEGRLTPSLLLRVLAHGHITFFEWSVSALAKVPHHRTWLMIHDAGPLGLRAIYERAGLPIRLFTAFRAGVDAFHSMEFDGGPRDQQRFQERMLERFLTQPTPTPREDLDYLMEKMDQRPEGQKKAARKSLAKTG
ncbi:MAG TPA: DUF2336 domain-containing protein [Caulobacteraceae bacterium]